MHIEIVRDAKGRVVAVSEVSAKEGFGRAHPQLEKGERVETKEVPDKLMSDPDALIKSLSK